MYGIRWQEFDRQHRLQSKEAIFETEKERDDFAAKLQKKDNFFQFIAWLDPQA